MQIMTSEGWKEVIDLQSIPPADRVRNFSDAKKWVLSNRFCGFVPTPRGASGMIGLQQFNDQVYAMARQLCADLNISVPASA